MAKRMSASARKTKNAAQRARRAGHKPSPTNAPLNAVPQPDPRLPTKYGDEWIEKNRAELEKRGLLSNTKISVSASEDRDPSKTPYNPLPAGDYDQTIAARQAVIDENLEPWQSPDPMREQVEKHIQPGMRPRYLSPRQVDKRGMRGWETVHDKNGNKIQIGDQFLAQMPEQKALQRQEHHRRKTASDLASVHENQQENIEKLVRAADKMGLAVVPTGETVTDHASSNSVPVGLSITRGAAPPGVVSERPA